jgi:hypothetical protein
MKLTEHLEHVIGLVERNASPAEIKGSLLALHQEAQGAERAVEENMKLVEKNAQLQKQVAQFIAASNLKGPKPGIPPQARNIK